MWPLLSSSRKVLLKKLSIPAIGNQFSVYLKQYSFICRFLVLVESQFLKNNLIPSSGNSFSGSWAPFFFLPFSDTPATDSFIFPSNGNVFVNMFCILVSHSGFSRLCKSLFYLFFRHWKYIFETNPSFWLEETGYLATGNQFFFHFQILLAVKAFTA